MRRGTDRGGSQQLTSTTDDAQLVGSCRCRCCYMLPPPPPSLSSLLLPLAASLFSQTRSTPRCLASSLLVVIAVGLRVFSFLFLLSVPHGRWLPPFAGRVIDATRGAGGGVQNDNTIVRSAAKSYLKTL